MIEGLEIVAVVAMARNRVIGSHGAMPWHLPGDLKRFRELTTGRPMIMGRRTLESIGRLLPGRDTIVLTRSPSVAVVGAIVASNPQEALRLAAEAARARSASQVVIAGGAEVYAAFMPWTDRIYLTRIEADPAGDTRLGTFETEFALEEEGSLSQAERDSNAYRNEVWLRRPPGS